MSRANVCGKDDTWQQIGKQIEACDEKGKHDALLPQCLYLQASFLDNPLVEEVLPGVQLQRLYVVQGFSGLVHAGVFALHDGFLYFFKTVAKRGIDYEGQDEDGQTRQERQPHIIEEKGKAETQNEGQSRRVRH